LIYLFIDRRIDWKGVQFKDCTASVETEQHHDL